MGSTQSMLAVNIYLGEGNSMSEFIAKEEYIYIFKPFRTKNKCRRLQKLNDYVDLGVIVETIFFY